MARDLDAQLEAFWTRQPSVVVYHDARVDLTRDDPSTPTPAIGHGLGNGKAARER